MIYTTAIEKIEVLSKFVRGVQGGTSAGKTFGILPVLIDECITNPFLEVSIVAESFPHLRRGAMKDFKKIMRTTNRWIDDHWRATDSTYTFSSGSTLEFFSADDDSKLRGARRDVLYMNEANNMTFHAYTELASRTKNHVYLDWNPVAPFWFHEHLQADSDVDFITLTYKDNEACPESALNFILKAKEKAKKSKYWENWYNVYGLGRIGHLQGVVFEDWEVKDIPDGARLLGYGLDFGFTNDPTAMVGVYKLDNNYYYKLEIYKKGLTNPDISEIIKSKGINKTIYADSAEPKSIEEIKRKGVKILPAVKGRDSILFGINKMQQEKFFVSSCSVELIKEFRNYTWMVSREGEKINKPIDNWNHGIDAIRYFHTSENRYSGKYVVNGL